LCGAAHLFAADEAGAKKAVDAWLAPHDRGDYAETWETSAQFVKDKVPKAQWEKIMSSTLAPLGKLESRSLVSETPTTELPGMADGRYVVFVYKAEYEHKKSAVETIIPMLEDGQWRVMTYRIR
jgi:hypothetical protein